MYSTQGATSVARHHGVPLSVIHTYQEPTKILKVLSKQSSKQPIRIQHGKLTWCLFTTSRLSGSVHVFRGYLGKRIEPTALKIAVARASCQWYHATKIQNSVIVLVGEEKETKSDDDDCKEKEYQSMMEISS